MGLVGFLMFNVLFRLLPDETTVGKSCRTRVVSDVDVLLTNKDDSNRDGEILVSVAMTTTLYTSMFAVSTSNELFDC